MIIFVLWLSYDSSYDFLIFVSGKWGGKRSIRGFQLVRDFQLIPWVSACPVQTPSIYELSTSMLYNVLVQLIHYCFHWKHTPTNNKAAVGKPENTKKYYAVVGVFGSRLRQVWCAVPSAACVCRQGWPLGMLAWPHFVNHLGSSISRHGSLLRILRGISLLSAI